MQVFPPRWTLYPRCALNVAQDFARAYLNAGSIFEAGKEIGLPFEEARLLLGSLATTALATHTALLQYGETAQHLRVHSLRGFRARRTSEPIADAERGGEWALHAISTPSGLIVSLAIAREPEPDPQWVVQQRPWPRRQTAVVAPDDSDTPGDRALEHEAYAEWLSEEWLSDEHLSPASLGGALLLRVLDYNYGPRGRARKSPGVKAGCVAGPLTIEQAIAIGWTPKALQAYGQSRATQAQATLSVPGGRAAEEPTRAPWRELAQAWVTAQRARWGIRRPRTTPYSREERIGIARVARAALSQGVKPTDLANALGVGRDTVDRFVADWKKGEFAAELPPPEPDELAVAVSSCVSEVASPPPVARAEASRDVSAAPAASVCGAGVVTLKNGTTILVSELEQLNTRRAATLAKLDTLVGRMHVRFGLTSPGGAVPASGCANAQGELWGVGGGR